MNKRQRKKLTNIFYVVIWFDGEEFKREFSKFKKTALKKAERLACAGYYVYFQRLKKKKRRLIFDEWRVCEN